MSAMFLPRQPRLLGAGVLRPLELGGEVEEEAPLLGVKSTSLRKLRLRRLKAMAAQIPSRSMGQVMQRGPPRPRPSSLPWMVTTSMPFLRR